jgi:AraC-like DNA-binding protein
MLTTDEKELYGENAHIVSKNSSDTKYEIECDTPTGFMHCYHLFFGVELAYTSFQAGSCFKREASMPHILEIAYCKAGRYECKYKNDYYTYLGEGDFAVTTITSQTELPSFPIGYYDGIAIIVNMEETGSCFAGIIEDVSIDLNALVEKFCNNRCCAVMKATNELRHVFEEICFAYDSAKLGYLRLKVLEVFYLLTELLPQADLDISDHYSGSRIHKIKAIKKELTENLDQKILLKTLTEKYDISLTTLKDSFKAVYGQPVHAFQREYKMQVATQLLTVTKSSITEIASQLGYENPNKFSSAFRSVIGMSPREYRQKNT